MCFKNFSGTSFLGFGIGFPSSSNSGSLSSSGAFSSGSSSGPNKPYVIPYS